MKHVLLTLLISLFVFAPFGGYSQDEDYCTECDPGGDVEDNAPAPIDDGVIVLLAGGLLFGIKKVYQKQS